MRLLILAKALLKFLVFIVPLLIGFLFQLPSFKGWFGEKMVALKARFSLPKDDYAAFHNVTLPDGEGTTQIDHIFVSRFGIFVIETKNMKGWIFGNASQPNWTQSIFKKKCQFQNPIRQNFKHIKTLENLLDVHLVKFKSVVVFVGDCKFKTELPPSVCRLGNFTDYIKSFQETILTEVEILEIKDKIEKGKLLPCRATNKAHVEYLKRKHGGKSESS